MGNILLTPCLPIMHCLGFTAQGIARGSLAALTQSCYGIVQAGSWFAQCQSAAALSSPCGCVAVLICWIVIGVSIAIWICGLPLWLEDPWGWWKGNSTTNGFPAWLENPLGWLNSTTNGVPSWLEKPLGWWNENTTTNGTLLNLTLPFENTTVQNSSDVNHFIVDDDY